MIGDALDNGQVDPPSMWPEDDTVQCAVDAVREMEEAYEPFGESSTEEAFKAQTGERATTNRRAP